MQGSLLIENGLILPAPGRTVGVPPCRGFVLVAGQRIAALGTMAELPADIDVRERIDARGQLVLPGLINCHVHAAMTLFRGMADDLALAPWLYEHIFPAEARFVRPQMVYDCSLLAAAEMIRAGITCAADGYFFEDMAAAAFRDAGLRGVAAQGVIDFPAPGMPEPGENINRALDFLTRSFPWRRGLVSPGIFCHSPVTCSPDTLCRAKALARDEDVSFFIHAAETSEEREQILARHGQSPVGLLHSLGILDERTVLVHAVWLDEDDIGIVAASGAGVVSCTSSNMKLGSGTAPLAAMHDRGIPLGLGTDGAASGNRLDIFAEMDLCAKVHKLRHMDATALPARNLLHCATRGGARVLGLEDCGVLAPEKKADIILVDVDSPRTTPFHSPDLLVYAADAHDVRSVLIDGRVVLREGRFANPALDKACARVRLLQEKLDQREAPDQEDKKGSGDQVEVFLDEMADRWAEVPYKGGDQKKAG